MEDTTEKRNLLENLLKCMFDTVLFTGNPIKVYIFRMVIRECSLFTPGGVGGFSYVSFVLFRNERIDFI